MLIENSDEEVYTPKKKATSRLQPIGASLWENEILTPKKKITMR